MNLSKKERKRQEAAKRLQQQSGAGGGINGVTPAASVEAAVSIPEIVEAAPTKATESSEVAQTSPVAEPSTPIDETALRSAWQQLRQAEDNYRSGRKSLDERLTQIDADRSRLDAERETLLSHKQQFDQDRQSLAAREAALIVEREALGKLRADAEAGFLESRRESLAKLDATIARLTGEASEQMESLAKKRKQLVDDVAAAQASAIQDEWQKIETCRREVAQARRVLDWDKQDFSDHRDLDIKKREAEVAGQLEQLNAERRQLEQRLDTARRERDSLFQEVERQRRAVEELGERSPDAVRQELERYRKEVKSLQERLANAPEPGVLDELQRAKTAMESQVANLRDKELQLAQQREALGRANIAVTELETIREERRVLDAHKRLLEAKITDLEGRLDQFIKGDADKSPFPECRRMDEDARRSTSPALRPQVPDLGRFIDDLQVRIAHQSRLRDGGRTLYYTKRDLRCFVGGLAMSQLHILQGISGTGKTSLPMAFAEAVGAGCRLISVQAGWRDRQDLLGHYNTFEKRYYETEFLQALYEAQTPEYTQRLYVIVLDEMNLSHPEQYAADLLSGLEKPNVADRTVELMTSRVNGAPKHFVDGRKVRLPKNVWFIGTANHDETTKDFADKTYDRAHVMELPRHRESFEFKDPMDVEPLSFDALHNAIGNASRGYGDHARKVYAFLDKHFAGVLGDLFGVSWGNRLERQASLFAPVVIAAGGTAVEALDHLLATKLLRKLRDRHDIRPEHFVSLRDALQKAPVHQLPLVVPRDNASAAAKSNERLNGCLEIVNKEIRRLGADQEQ